MTNIGRKSDAELDAEAEAAGERLANELHPMSIETIKGSLEGIIEEALFCRNTPELRAEIADRCRTFLEEVAKEAPSFEVICDESNNPESVVNDRKFVVRVRISARDVEWLFEATPTEGVEQA